MNAKEVLTEEQRRRLKGIPEADDPKARQYYTFTKQQLDSILRHRRDHNRLGFAVQLALVTYPGWPLSHYKTIPPSTLAYIAGQLGIAPEVFAQYAKREPTRREHLEEIRRSFGFTAFSAGRYRQLVRRLYVRALHHDDPVELMETAVSWLRENRVIFPAVSTVERMVWEAGRLAESKIYAMLNASLTEEQKRRMDEMLAAGPNKGDHTLAWVRDSGEQPSPEGFLKVAERLTWLRQLGVRVDTGGIAPERLARLIRMAGTYDPYMYGRLRQDKKYGLLALHLHTLHAQLTDRAVRIHDRLVGRFISEWGLRRRKGQMTATVGQAPASSTQMRAMFKKQFGRLRKYAPVLLETLAFDGNEQAAPLLKAIRELRARYARGKRSAAMEREALGFLPDRRRRLAVSERGTVYSYMFEIAVMIEIRNQLRAGNVWIAGSAAHKPYEQYLSPAEDAAAAASAAAEASPYERPLDDYLESSRIKLAERLPLISHPIGPAGARPVGRPRKDSGRLRRLKQSLYGELPDIRLTDLLREVDSWTRFTDRFVHASTNREPEGEEKERILDILVGLGTMSGWKAASGSGAGATYRQLMHTLQWHINEETLAQAQAALIRYQGQLPPAAWWEEDGVTSSDVQPVPVVASARGGDSDTMYLYRCMNARSMIVSTGIAPRGQIGRLLEGAASSDAPSVRHYCHASGFADRLFGLACLLGIRLLPRLRRLQPARLYRIGNMPASPLLRPGRIDTRIVRETAGDLRRLACSIRLGTASAGRMYRKVQSQERLNRAITELGRIEKTLFYTELMSHRALHEDIARDALRWDAARELTRRMTGGQEWALNEKNADEYARMAHANSLIFNAIVIWNSVQLERAVRKLRIRSPDDRLLRHVSPLYGNHVNMQPS